MILVYFPSGGWVNDVVNNWTNYKFTLVIVIHFINGAGVCWFIRRTVFNECICLNHDWKYKHKQIKRYHEKPRY